MKIELENENKICIELSSDDMNSLGITFEELDYKNIETRRVIWTLLDEARHTLGRDINPCEKMLIEVSKSREGGCKICFTVTPEGNSSNGRLIVKREQSEIVAKFSDFTALDSFLLLLKNSNGLFEESEIYTYKNSYYAVFEPLPSKRAALQLMLMEYSSLIPSNTACISMLREHGRLIMRGNYPQQVP